MDSPERELIARLLRRLRLRVVVHNLDILARSLADRLGHPVERHVPVTGHVEVLSHSRLVARHERHHVGQILDVGQGRQLHTRGGNGHGPIPQDAVHEELLTVLGRMGTVDVLGLEHRERRVHLDEVVLDRDMPRRALTGVPLHVHGLHIVGHIGTGRADKHVVLHLARVRINQRLARVHVLSVVVVDDVKLPSRVRARVLRLPPDNRRP